MSGPPKLTDVEITELVDEAMANGGNFTWAGPIFRVINDMETCYPDVDGECSHFNSSKAVAYWNADYDIIPSV